MFDLCDQSVERLGERRVGEQRMHVGAFVAPVGGVDAEHPLEVDRSLFVERGTEVEIEAVDRRPDNPTLLESIVGAGHVESVTDLTTFGVGSRVQLLLDGAQKVFEQGEATESIADIEQMQTDARDVSSVRTVRADPCFDRPADRLGDLADQCCIGLLLADLQRRYDEVGDHAVPPERFSGNGTPSAFGSVLVCGHVPPRRHDPRRFVGVGIAVVARVFEIETDARQVGCIGFGGTRGLANLIDDLVEAPPEQDLD